MQVHSAWHEHLCWSTIVLQKDEWGDISKMPKSTDCRDRVCEDCPACSGRFGDCKSGMMIYIVRCCSSPTLERKGVRDAGYRWSELYRHHMQCWTISWAAYCACMSACLWNLNWMASAERIGTTLFSSTYIILLCLLVGSEWDYQQTKILYIGELYAV